MGLLIQHGHGKGQKISDAIDDGSAKGVIFAARNEKIAKLDAYLSELCSTYSNIDLLFDPQFFISTIVPANDRFLDEYPFYQAGRALRDFVGARRIRSYVGQTIGFQYRRQFTRIISPTVLVNSFADRWAQISLQLADISADYHKRLNSAQPLLLNVLLAESALDDRSELDTFLDSLTTWDVQGFYICICREDAEYSQVMDPDRLAHLLYLVYVLADRNGYEVTCGYSDFVGLLLRAAGASAFGNGWYLSLRQFHRKAFTKQTQGGSPAVLRYSSAPLMNCIRLSELDSINDAGLLPSALSGTSYDGLLTRASRPSASAWNGPCSELHHWSTLAILDKQLTGVISDDMTNLAQRLRNGRGALTMLRTAGVPFEKPSLLEQHYASWLAAIDRFRRMTGV